MNINDNSVILRAKAALTDAPSMNLVKPTYGFVNTSDLVARFERQGWYLSQAGQVNVKDPDRQGYQRHLLRFRNDQFKTIQGLKGHHESIPELIIENSHDGTSALRIFFGVFRIACLNGLIAGTSLTSFRTIHSKNSIKNIDQGIESMTDSIPLVVARVNELQGIELNAEKQIILAGQAVDLRLAHTKGIQDVNLQGMLNPLRHADTGTDAFTILNRIQERVIRGGIQYRQLNEKTNTVERRTSRAINSVSQSVKLNRELWNIFDSALVS